MNISDLFHMKLEIPMRRSERQTYGLDDANCALLVKLNDPADKHPWLASVVDDVLPQAANLVALILGDFGSAGLGRIEGSKALANQAAGHAYLVPDKDALSAMLDANVETIVFFRTETDPQTVLKNMSLQFDPWWKLSAKSEVSIITKMKDVLEPTAIYSPSDSAVQFIGGEPNIINVFHRLENWIKRVSNDRGK